MAILPGPCAILPAPTTSFPVLTANLPAVVVSAARVVMAAIDNPSLTQRFGSCVWATWYSGAAASQSNALSIKIS
eukprot:gene11843-biopygen9678